jgi:EF-P beta-lysylation protein EpmB
LQFTTDGPLKILAKTAATIESWHDQLSDIITSPDELLQLLRLEPEEVDLSEQAGRDFSFKVPRAFAARMNVGDPNDPLLKQVLASAQELLEAPGFTTDPLEETGAANPHPGIIHKYKGRALLLLTGVCAINCRYCFRRHFPYEDNRNSRDQWQQALTYIAEDSSISEVILSGGDPLIPGDRYLQEIIDTIEAISHVTTVRIHTRLPIVLPARITAGLGAVLTNTRLRIVIVNHCNHAQEIDAQVSAALSHLRSWDVTLLNQAVLLSGINDSASIQIELSQALHANGVLPYYLHLLDPIKGAHHFEVDEKSAVGIMREVIAALPGYLVPRLVREVAGETAKRIIPINPCP